MLGHYQLPIDFLVSPTTTKNTRLVWLVSWRHFSLNSPRNLNFVEVRVCSAPILYFSFVIFRSITLFVIIFDQSDQSYLYRVPCLILMGFFVCRPIQMEDSIFCIKFLCIHQYFLSFDYCSPNISVLVFLVFQHSKYLNYEDKLVNTLYFQTY